MSPKDRRCKRGIHLFRTNIPELAVQDKIVSFGAQVDRCLFAEEYKGEYIAILSRTRTVRTRQLHGAVETHLRLTIEKEFIRVDPIYDGAPDKGEPVENNGWLIRVFKQELSQDIKNHGHGDQGRQPNDAEDPYRLGRAVFA